MKIDVVGVVLFHVVCGSPWLALVLVCALTFYLILRKCFILECFLKIERISRLEIFLFPVLAVLLAVLMKW